MASRLAACEPCRSSKLACDHSRPVCSRCRNRNRADSCVYRLAPFKKKRKQLTPIAPSERSSRLPSTHSSETETSLPNVTATPRLYPNPGYLGSSSHTTLFDHFSPTDHHDIEQRAVSADGANIANGAKFIGELAHFPQLQLCFRLVEAWTSKGANLALVKPFTHQCASTVQTIFRRLTVSAEEAVEISRSLFKQSCSPLTVNAETTMKTYCTNFCHNNARWETLGIFFAAVSQAAVDLASFEPIYSTEEQRRIFRRRVMQYSDRCLEISLSLDCLNDLQLLLQYENWIIHSHIDGDQSYHAWRRLGDVVSSLFALGYHERVLQGTPVPDFLRELRQAAFARAYSADKNVSIFLGRPPRASSKYCHFELPGGAQNGGYSNTSQQPFIWPPDEPFDFVIETRWSSICAILKEEALDLFREKNHADRVQKAQTIQSRAEAQWAALPAHFRLTTPLKSHNCSPLERDFLASARLNYLHIHFLTSLSLQQHMPEPDAPLISISARLLAVVSESIIAKQTLVNSGTSLVWKVVYYGLAAAGIVCLSLLHLPFPVVGEAEVSVAKVIQDLHVVVAEVESGTLVREEDPNYALLSRAALTIKSLLERILSRELGRGGGVGAGAGAGAEGAGDMGVQMPVLAGDEEWRPWDSYDLQDFEEGFWTNLAGHPFLVGGGEGM
ncbi:hypothetical protein BS50DRAFT_485249 [Corynespora cassiicola Philippines]|uniref:Zn(2)-C6 fungal-type domain-containing protein n=1 Tax=Corynespora cassiicola Philippines TaxID=1448308 RepID=A0A2T2P4Y1_CORCC|nr:hypothetical protein BS50DRAFT_485249 [Corynespora cassiicola Philippines]